jgi:hypothetical protein
VDLGVAFERMVQECKWLDDVLLEESVTENMVDCDMVSKNVPTPDTMRTLSRLT